MADLIKGITVVLTTKTQSGTDGFGMPTYTTSTVNVENVLVSPASTEDVELAFSTYGKHATYQLAIPKGDTNTWENTTVTFFGYTWKTIGYPQEGIEDMIPLSWNRKVLVERWNDG